MDRGRDGEDGSGVVCPDLSTHRTVSKSRMGLPWLDRWRILSTLDIEPEWASCAYVGTSSLASQALKLGF